MRFRLNLASQPYENVRRFLLAWSLLLAVAGLLTAALVFAAGASLRTVYHTRRLVTAEREKLTQLEQQEKADLAVLNRPENREVRDRSQLINSLIRRKQFSWTLIFADLERIMPARLHVVSITPELDADNQIEVRMLVAGESREKAIELVQRMERSKTFRRAQVLSEMNRLERGEGEGVQFEITALYVPEVPAERSGD